MVERHKIAGRYASAIFGCPTLSSDLSLIAGELEKFGAVVEQNKELQLVCSGVLFPVEQVIQVVADLGEKMQLSGSTQQILRVLAQAKRIMVCQLIAKKLEIKILESQKIVPIEVLSRGPLASEDQSKIEKHFESLFGKKVAPEYEEDASMLGNLLVRANGKTFDGSLLTRFESLEEHMLGGN